MADHLFRYKIPLLLVMARAIHDFIVPGFSKVVTRDWACLTFCVTKSGPDRPLRNGIWWGT